MAKPNRQILRFRPVSERFRGVRWKRQNRLWHEKYTRTDPRFSAACKLDWSRILKRPDTRHGDGRQVALVARTINQYRIVYFVVYVKRNGLLNVISIRYAETYETFAFTSYYP